MSAYLCDPVHIGALAAIAAARTQRWGDASKVAQRLALANLKSVAYRYSRTEDETAHDEKGVSKRTYIADCQESARGMNPDFERPQSEIDRMVSTFCYQACEFPGWSRSNSVKICTLISTPVTEL